MDCPSLADQSDNDRANAATWRGDPQDLWQLLDDDRDRDAQGKAAQHRSRHEAGETAEPEHRHCGKKYADQSYQSSRHRQSVCGIGRH